MNEEEFMSDIKDETSVDIDTAEKSVDMIKDYYNREHKHNKDRIKYGIIEYDSRGLCETWTNFGKR